MGELGECSEQQLCPCYKESQDFQKLVELQDFGLVIYCHRTCPENVTQGEANISRDVFILHKNKDMKITTSELISEIDKKKISCPRCRKKVEHAQELMQKVKSIDSKIVMGICDHCRKKAQTIRNQFCACDEIVKKFITFKGEQKENIKKYVKIWLSKTGHLKDDIKFNKPQQIKSRAYSDLQFNRDFNSLASRHEPEIKQMFYSESTLKTEISETGLKGDVKQDVAFILPTEPVETYFAPIKHEGEKMDTNIPDTTLVDSETAFVESYEADKGILKSSIKDTKQEEIFEKKPSMDAKEELKRRHDLSLRQMMTLKKDAGVPLPLSKTTDIYESPKIAPWEQKDTTSKHHVESETNIKIPTITKHDRGLKKADKYHQNQIEKGLLDFIEGPKQDKKLNDYTADEVLQFKKSEKTKKQIQSTVKLKRSAVEPLFSSFFFSKDKEKKKEQKINVTSSHLIDEVKEKEKEKVLLQAERKKKRQEEEHQQKLEQAQKKEFAQEEKNLKAEQKKRQAFEDDEVTGKGNNDLKGKSEARVEEDKQNNKQFHELHKVMDESRVSEGREKPSQEKDATSNKGKAIKKLKDAPDKIKVSMTKIKISISKEKQKKEKESKHKHLKEGPTKGLIKTDDKEGEKSDTDLKTKSVKKAKVTKKGENDLKVKLETRVKEDKQKIKRFQELQKVMDKSRVAEGREKPSQEKDATSMEGKATKKIKDAPHKIKVSMTKIKISISKENQKKEKQSKHKPLKEEPTKGLIKTDHKEGETSDTDLKTKSVKEAEVTKKGENDLKEEKDATSKEGKATIKVKDSSDKIKVAMSKIKIPITQEKQDKEKESKHEPLKEEPTKGLIKTDDTLKKLQAEHIKEREAAFKSKKALEAEANQAKLKDQAKRNIAQELEIKNIKIARDSGGKILDLIRIKQAAKMRPKDISTAQKNIHKSHHTKSGQYSPLCPLCLNSDLEILLDEIKRLPTGKTDIIIGEKIVTSTHMPRLEKTEEPEGVPILFQKHIHDESEEQLKELQIIPQKTDPLQKQILTEKDDLSKKDGQETDKGTSKGVIRYALSDRTFIDKGWTVLPTEKVVRKMNVYRMRPAHPEFDWFEHNKNKRLMTYNTGERLAEFDDNGRGRWYYRSGQLALDYYDAEETHAQQRFVVYSSGEPDERGRTHPITILATFDYLGNGVVFDHAGKIRLKYNQTEGVVLDRAIGPVSHWQWHSLNDPPVLQQVMIDTQMAHKDPNIVKLGKANERKSPPQNEDMLAIEFDNFIKEKSKKLSQQFKPFQIKMKALKINEYFSLKVLDQAAVYLIFRDGSTNLKLNIGMVLDHQEIIDTDTAEVGEVSNSLELFPARTDSLEGLQRSVGYAQRYERQYVERQRWLRPSVPCASADKLTAATSPPMRLPLRTVSNGPSSTTRCCSGKLTDNLCLPLRTVSNGPSSTTRCCSGKLTDNLYYDTRLLC